MNNNNIWKKDNLLLREKDLESSGSYSSTFGDSLGKALTYAHSTIIRKGNELEKALYSASSLPLIDNIEFLSVNYICNELNEGDYLIDRSSFFNSGLCIRKGETNKFGIQPDVITIHKDNNEIILNLIEVKLGYTFDTKKIKGERDHIDKEKLFLKRLFKGKGIKVKVNYFFASWYQMDKSKLMKGCKSMIYQNEVLVRNELCDIIKATDTEVENTINRFNYEKKKEFIDLLLENEENYDDEGLILLIKSILDIEPLRNKVISFINCYEKGGRV